jgi:hypothetical protein
MPHLTVGDRIGSVRPTIYDPTIVYFTDDFKNLDNWVASGNYTLTEEGVRLDYGSSLVSKGSLFRGRNFFSIKVRFKILAVGDMVLAGFTDENNNPTVYFKVNSAEGTISAYVNDQVVHSWYLFPFSLGDWIDMYIIKGERMIMVKVVALDPYAGERLEWDYGILVDPNTPTDNVLFSTTSASLVFNSVAVHEASGVWFGMLRPIWTRNNKILSDGEYFYFATIEQYNTTNPIWMDTIRLLILRTKDFVNFEHYKHISLGNAPFGSLLYSFFDGSNFYIWMRNELGEYYQNGLHPLYLVTVDSNYNLVDVNLGVTLNGYQGTKPLESIYFVEIDGAWHAILNAIGEGLFLFDGAPWSPILTFNRQIYSDAYVPRIITAHPVSNGRDSYVAVFFPTSWHPSPAPNEPSYLPPRILISDTKFRSVRELTRFRIYDSLRRELHVFDIEAVLFGNYVMYVAPALPR